MISVTFLLFRISSFHLFFQIWSLGSFERVIYKVGSSFLAHSSCHRHMKVWACLARFLCISHTDTLELKFLECAPHAFMVVRTLVMQEHYARRARATAYPFAGNLLDQHACPSPAPRMRERHDVHVAHAPKSPGHYLCAGFQVAASASTFLKIKMAFL